ncbi:unnamed protein product [Rotaria sp. Silwood1]|nr:unnamed protein product [Rotaria sp. Silwood1]
MINLVICLECTSSMASYLNEVRRMIISIFNSTVALNPNAIRMSLIQFRSRARHDVWLTNTYASTQNINVLNQWPHKIEAFGGSEDEGEAVGDALQEALNIFRLLNDDNGRFDKKLVILITDGPPSGLVVLLNGVSGDRFAQANGADPWLVANEFNRERIALAIVGVEPGIVQCDDYYCALARKTGGLYIPLINATYIISSVIRSVIINEYTFHKAFLGIKIDNLEQNSLFKYSAMKQRVNGMLMECKSMADIQKLFFNYRTSY